MRALGGALALLLAGLASAQQPADSELPAHRAKLQEYLSYGWSPERSASGLTSWFGWSFTTTNDWSRGTVDVQLVLRRADGQIYHLRTIGSVQRSNPTYLITQ